MSAAPEERLVVDAGQERAVGRFRLLAALASVPAAALVLATDPPLPLALLAFAGLLIGVGWLFAFRAARRRAAGPERALVLGAHALRLELGGPPEDIPWRRMDAVELDDERLMVRIKRPGQRDLTLASPGGGLSLEDFHARMEARWQAARGA
ncbi:MAG: hypothetical protein AAF447_11285 [Myxococcota bacterium]